MAIIRWKRDDVYNPWSELDRLQDEINDLFDLDRLPATTGLFDRPVSPAIDIVENPGDFKVICELPGIDLKDIDVSITANVLTLKGEKKGENTTERNRTQEAFKEPFPCRPPWTRRRSRPSLKTAS